MTGTVTVGAQALSHLLNDRYSCRAFTDRQVPDEDMRTMLDIPAHRVVVQLAGVAGHRGQREHD